MVDMVEARKRAKAKAQESAGKNPPQTNPAMEAQVPAIREKPVPALPESAASSILPEDQAHFLQRLLEQESGIEEIEQAEDTLSEDVLEVLVFQLGKERYGIEIQHVAEIIRFLEPTKVPHTVSFLDGIISLRGRMIPVVNAAKRFGRDPSPPNQKTRILVLHDHAEFTGILVDSASQVLRLPKKDIEPTPFVVSGVDAEFIDAVCEHKGQLIILLNLNRFLQLV